MTLFEASKGRDNNLNLMRIIAAVMVIFSHSWPISYGADHSDFLNTFSKGQITFGNVSVCLFFFLGGFLIMSSAERSRTARVFFKKRVERLFPSLIAVVVCTVFILGPFLTKLDLASYFTNIDTYKYLLNAVLLPVHSLPGVFTNNIYGTTVNGPLWTMPVEFACYVICFFMYAIHMTNQKKMKYTIILFIPSYIFMFYILRNYSVLQAALRPMGLFYAGMLFYVYREKIVLKGWLALAAGIILIVSLPTNTLDYVILFTFSYVTAYLGFAVKKNYHFLDGKPDLSYQIYLCACPIQQIISQMNGGSMNNILNFIESLPLTIIAAAILYEVADRKLVSLLKRKA